MDADQDLIQAADENFIGSYRKLVEHIPEGSDGAFGGIYAFATGLPISLFNGCIVATPSRTEDLTSALEWVEDGDVPFRLWIHEELADELGRTARRRGLERDTWVTPQMVLQPVPELPSPGLGVTIGAVSDVPLLAAYRAIFVEDGMSEGVAHRLFADSFAADPDVQLVIAYLDGRPVGTSLAIRSGHVAGVYAVGTVPSARRRGVGTAVTWAAVDGARSWGCEAIVLQSSEMGFPMYLAMGFSTVVRYVTYRTPQ